MTQLTRAIRLPQATAIVVGIIIGASVFVQASEITALVPSLLGVALVWVVAGLLTMGGALVCAELSSALPRTGGVYVFLREIYSPALGFLWGWAMFWSMHTGIAAAIATVFARYAGYFVPMGDGALRARRGRRHRRAVGRQLLGCALRQRGADGVHRRQGGGGRASIILAGAVHRSGERSAERRRPWRATFGAGDFLLAVGAGLFAFGGWHMVTYTAEETQRSRADDSARRWSSAR